MTGASAGLGQALARELARRQYDLVLVARRRDRLAALATELSDAHGTKSVSIDADLANADGRERLLAGVDAIGRLPTLFVNNAGFGHSGHALEIPTTRSHEMVDLNVTALMHLTIEMVRRMKSGGGGSVLNIASTAAYQPVPWMAVYGATKAFVLSFSEALNAELDGTGVRVFATSPGYIDTEFQQVAGVGPGAAVVPYTTPEEFAVRCIDAYEEGRTTHLDGAVNKLSIFSQRFVPRSLAVYTQKKYFKPKK